jgi:hypothetical protein
LPRWKAWKFRHGFASFKRGPLRSILKVYKAAASDNKVGQNFVANNAAELWKYAASPEHVGSCRRYLIQCNIAEKAPIFIRK